MLRFQILNGNNDLITLTLIDLIYKKLLFIKETLKLVRFWSSDKIL